MSEVTEPPPEEPTPAAERPWYTQPAFVAVIASLVLLVVALLVLRTPDDPTVAPPTEPATEEPTEPAPTAEATATAEPEPEAEAEPSPVPSPTPTADLPPEVETVEGPQPEQLAGEGSASVGPIDHEGGLVVLHAVHDGEGAFALTVSGPDEEDEELVNADGPYQGSRAFGRDAGAYTIDVTADGAWSISWEQPRYSAAPELPLLIEGRGDTASTPFSTTGGEVRFEWTLEGEDEIVITVLTADGEELGELGGTSGGSSSVDMPGGIYLLDVVAPDVWRITGS